MYLIALPVLAADVCNAWLLALHQHYLQWLDALLSPRLHDEHGVPWLANVLNCACRYKVLKHATGLFAVAVE